MKQIVQSYSNGELWLAEVPIPFCKEGGVVLQTRNSFISAGTEKMLVDFSKKNLIGKAIMMPDQVQKVIRKIKSEGLFATLEKVQAKLDQPISLGYSCAGVVMEAGSKAPGLHSGDRVAAGGVGYACHAEYNFVPKNLIARIPDNVSFEDASCATIGAIALQGVRQCDPRLGEYVCVIGLGLLGLLAVQFFTSNGVRVIGFDPDAARCALAQSLGCHTAVTTDLIAAANEFSKGRGMDAVLITAATKSNDPIILAGEISRLRGTIVATGLVGMDIPRDIYYKKELVFKLSLSYGPGRYDTMYEEGGHDYPYSYVRWTEQRNMEAFLNLVASGHVTPSKIVTHTFDIENALNAYELLLGVRKEPYLGILLNYSPKDAAIEPKDRIIVRKKTVSQTSLGIGFIGTGNFTKGVLLPVLGKTGAPYCLKGMCATTGMNALQSADRYGFEYATTDYKELLNDAAINTIFITTRHNTHAGLVVEALHAGKHVFVEKPLAMNHQQLSEVQQAAAANNRVLAVGFNRRFSGHASLLRSYFSMRKGPLVLTYRVNAGMIPAENWVQDPEIGGGRIIGEVCHFVDFASYIIGQQPVEVQASAVVHENRVVSGANNTSVNILYDDGSLAHIIYTAAGPADLPKERCEIFADASVGIMEDFTCTRCFGHLGNRKLKGKQSKGHQEELQLFFDAVTGKIEYPVAVTEWFSTTAITFLIEESLKKRTSIVVNG